MMATVHHVTAWAGRKRYQAAWFLLNRVYKIHVQKWCHYQKVLNFIAAMGITDCPKKKSKIWCGMKNMQDLEFSQLQDNTY